MDTLPSILDRLVSPGQDAHGSLDRSYMTILDGLCRALLNGRKPGALTARMSTELLAGLQAVQQIAKQAQEVSMTPGPWSYTSESIPLGGSLLSLTRKAPQAVELGFQLDPDFDLHGILSLLIGSGQDEQVFSFDLEQAKEGWVLRRWDGDVPVRARLELPSGSVVPWKSAKVFDPLAALLPDELSVSVDWLKGVFSPDATPPQLEVPTEASLAVMPETRLHPVGAVQALVLQIDDQRLPLTARLTIGRNPDNHLFLKDPKVSSHHAVLEPVQAGWLVRDLDSANGTWLNDRRVTRVALLKVGDCLVLGDTEIHILPSA
jgi:hypothetical protein